MLLEDLIEIVPNRYRILNELGRGAKKLVVLAFDNRLERAVAIAAMPADPAFEELSPAANEEQRLHEARTMAQLSEHPHVVTIHDTLNVKGTHLLITRYMPGGNLQSLLEKGPIELARAKRIAQQILSALAHAHDRSVVHRDLKPQNVLLDDLGNVGLIDFGLATWGKRNAAPGQMMGTIGYMAPEQIRGQTATAATDIYAFGCVLFELLTGRAVFEEDNMFASIRRHLLEEPEPPSKWNRRVPSTLDALCLACLAKEPARRPATALAAMHLLKSDDVAQGNEVADEATMVVTAAATAADAFVGREAELETLKRLVLRLNGSVGGAVLIEGEPGTGKSTLLQQLRPFVEGLGLTWLFGRALETLRIPNAVLLDALRPIHDGLADGDRAFLAAESALGSSEVFRARVGELVLRAAANHPLVLTIEDIHWLDEGSLELLLHLISRVRYEKQNAKVLVICSIRSSALSQSRFNKINRLRLDASLQKLSLKSLTENDVRLQISQLVGQPASNQLAQGVYAITLGNPLFTTRLVEYLMRRNLLVTRARFVTTHTPLAQMSVPPTVYAVLRQELETLPEVALQALQAAAVLPGDASVAAIAKVSELSENQLLEALELACDRAFLLDKDGVFAFVHPMVKEAIYEQMSELRRSTLHQRAVERTIDATTPSGLLESAHHLLRIVRKDLDVEHVITQVSAAAEYAFTQFAWQEAIRLAQSALALETKETSLRYARLHWLAADALHQHGQVSLAVHHWRIAAQFYRQQGNHLELVRILSMSLRARDNFSLRDEQFIQDQQELHELADQLPNNAADDAIEAFDTLAGVAISRGDLAQGEALYRLTAELPASPLKRARAENLKSMIHLANGDPRRSTEVLKDSLKAIKAFTNHPTEVRVHQRLPVGLYLQGALADAERAVDKALKASVVISSTGEHSITLSIACALATLRGDFAGAMALADAAVETLCVSGYSAAITYLVPTAAAAFAHAGEFARARAVVVLLDDRQRLFEGSLRMGRLQSELSNLLDQMEHQLDTGQFEARALRVGPIASMAVSRWVVMAEASRCGAAVGSLDAVEAAVERALGQGIEYALGWTGSMRRWHAWHRGRGGSEGERATSIVELEEMVGQLKRSGARFEAARATLDWAELLFAAKRAPATARRLLDESMDVFTTMKAEYWRQRVLSRVKALSA